MSRGAARLGLLEARITGGFWKERIDTVAGVTLDRQWKALNDLLPGAHPSHSLMNFRIAAGERQGKFEGTMWQDSDLAKWLEAASYCLALGPDPVLASRVNEVIDLVGRAQGPDGYLYTWVALVAPEMRWRDLAWGHELYCAGHFIEAAVAHHEATSSTRLLDIGRRLADCVDREFGPREGQNKGVCGHPEIELALFRLYRATGEPRYRDLAIHFLETRGRDPGFFAGKEPLGFSMPLTKAIGPDYFLAHAPVRGQAGAEGHAVRAMYLYAALAEEYLATGDEELRAALSRFWDSAVGRRMYITGSLGSQAQGERFTVDWDLPSDTAYGETCASIGLAFWASRMSEIEADSRYADTLERVALNGVLSGLSREGTRYFYVNPLELVPRVAAARMDLEHVSARRVEWLGCACCPPNIARFVASFASNLYGRNGDTLYVHQFAESEAAFELDGTKIRLTQATRFPWSGSVRFRLDFDGPPRDFDVALRIPSWNTGYRCAVPGGGAPADVGRDGYLHLRRRWSAAEEFSIEFAQPLRFIRADSRVRELADRVALQRGPLVYCVEGIDNGDDLHELAVEPGAPSKEVAEPDLGDEAIVVELEGFRSDESAEPPSGRSPYLDAESEPARLSRVLIHALPYYLWGNRAPGAEMRVWLRRFRTGTPKGG